MSYTEKWQQQSQMLAHRIRKNKRHLRKWLRRSGVTCYRLYDRDIPEIPLAIDWYEGRVYIAEYARRHPYTPDEHAMWIEWMVETLCEELEVERDAVFMKQRERKRGKEQYERLGEQSFHKRNDQDNRFVVEECGVKFWVNLSDYLDTGLFLDHRPTRLRVREEVEGKRFLNLFAYTGAFTIHAAAGGARRTLTVDMSNRYIQWAKDNLALNELTAEEHEFVRDDVFAFLRNKDYSAERFHVAVIDPPTFSNSKKMVSVLDIQRDHPWLINKVLDRMFPGGVIYFSNNYRKFQLSDEEIRGASIEDISFSTIPQDFRDKKIHRCWRIVRL